jgi:hypothetical protein
VIVNEGRSQAVENERLEIIGAESVLVLMRVEYLDDADA